MLGPLAISPRASAALLPFVEADPAPFLEAQPAIDAVTHLDGEPFRRGHPLRKRREVHGHPDVVAAVLESVGQQAFAEVRRARRGPDVLGAGDPERAHPVQRRLDDAGRLLRRRVGGDHRVLVVVVVDGAASVTSTACVQSK